MGDILNRHLSEVTDCSSGFNPGELAHDGRVTPLTFNTVSGVPETFYFRFFALSDGLLGLGGANLAEQQRVFGEFRAMNTELNTLARQLQRANAELRASDSLHARHAKEMRDYNEALRQQGLASLNLMEDATEARKRVEQANLALRRR